MEDPAVSPSRATPKRITETKPAVSSITGASNKTATIKPNVQIDGFREAALRHELIGIRNINQVIEGISGSSERAKGNMETASRTVNIASTLLNTWTRILSQTEHNQRLILNPNWHGTNQDMSNIENENISKQQEKDRRQLEEAQRREASQKKMEEEEQRTVDEPSGRNNQGIRGRGSGAVRGGKHGYNGTGGQVSGRGVVRGAVRNVGTTTERSHSGIRRGLGGRGRGRGLS